MDARRVECELLAEQLTYLTYHENRPWRGTAILLNCDFLLNDCSVLQRFRTLNKPLPALQARALHIISCVSSGRGRESEFRDSIMLPRYRQKRGHLPVNYTQCLRVRPRNGHGSSIALCYAFQAGMPVTKRTPRNLPSPGGSAMWFTSAEWSRYTKRPRVPHGFARATLGHRARRDICNRFAHPGRRS